MWMRVATRAAERLSRLELEPQATAARAPRVKGAASRGVVSRLSSVSRKATTLIGGKAKVCNPCPHSFICHQITAQQFDPRRLTRGGHRAVARPGTAPPEPPRTCRSRGRAACRAAAGSGPGSAGGVYGQRKDVRASRGETSHHIAIVSRITPLPHRTARASYATHIPPRASP